MTVCTPSVLCVYPAPAPISAPASTPSAIALNVYLECRFSVSDRLSIRVTGRDSHLIPANEENLIWKTAAAVAPRADLRLPPVELAIDNDIPIGKGLGSSAAALTAGVIIAERLLELGWKPARILDEAARLEGHPDNVAASVLGSIVASGVESGGSTRAIRIEMPPQFDLAVVVPDFVVPTKESRAVLPDCYSRADAVHNVQRMALLVAALATGDASAFPAALDDRLHQPFRARLVPGLAEILQLAQPGPPRVYAQRSGPQRAACFSSAEPNTVCELVRGVFAANGCQTEVISTGVSRHGYQFL